ncbi:MAG: hypothetical protein ACLP7Q_24055 [Isosphaeraceae bacterium]
MRDQRRRFSWLATMATAMGLVAGSVWAQPPDGAPGADEPCERTGFLHRWIHHSAHQLQDKFIGYPDRFIEPPLGFYVREQMTMQVSKADPHRFTLYRTDFLPGTDRFSPTGASRFNLMFSRIPGWIGPVTVEWTPDEPGLAEARRQAVLATLDGAGQPLTADRVVIGPSPYPGAISSESVNSYNVMINRGPAAFAAYPVTPQPAAYSYSAGGSQ